MAKYNQERLKNFVVVSDLHAGCQLALCPPGGIRLDNGGTYKPTRIQQKLHAWWREFWDEWVPVATKGEPYGVIVNGDALDGRHHNATSQISQSLSDQSNVAYELLAPVVERAAAYWHLRGTEAHVGPSGEMEEMLAERLGARQNADGQRAWFELWLQVGNHLAHIMHHIGTTGSAAYETTALCKEYAESCAEAARWSRPAPDVIVRSHRHRSAKVEVPTNRGYGICHVTPGWQLKTPFVYKIPGGRVTTPQVGGILLREGDEELFTRSWVREIERPKTEVVYV